MTERPDFSLDGAMPLADFLGIRAAADHPDGAWVAEMPASSQTLNTVGVVHGGATATLIDWSAGWGALYLTGCTGTTTDIFIRYLAAAREGSTLRATTTIDRVGFVEYCADGAGSPTMLSGSWPSRTSATPSATGRRDLTPDAPAVRR